MLGLDVGNLVSFTDLNGMGVMVMENIIPRFHITVDLF